MGAGAIFLSLPNIFFNGMQFQSTLTKFALAPKLIITDPKCYTFLKTRDTWLQLYSKGPIDPVNNLLVVII